MLRGSVSGDGVEMGELASKLRAMKPLSVSTLDGIKLNFDDGWLLVRPSGTEPKIRVTVEARGKTQGKRLYDEAVTIIGDCVAERER